MTTKLERILWNRTFIYLLFLVIFLYIGISMISSTLSLYIVENLNGSPAQVSLVSSLMAISSLIFRPVAGFLVDRFGRRSMMAISFITTAIIAMAYLLPNTITELCFLHFLMGIPFSINTIGTVTLRTDLIPEEKRAEGFNICSTITMFSAFMIGPNLAFWIKNNYGFNVLYPVAAATILIALGFLFLLKFDDIKTDQNRLQIKDVFEKSAIWFALITGILSISWPGVMTFGPLFSKEIGISFGGYLFLAYGGGLILSLGISRIILKEGQSPNLTAVSLILAFIGYGLIGFIPSKINFLLGTMALGIGYGLAFSIYKKMALDLVEPERRGRCSATLLVSEDIGKTIGLFAYSFVANSFGGLAYSYRMASIISIIPLFILLWVAIPYYHKKMVNK